MSYTSYKEPGFLTDNGSSEAFAKLPDFEKAVQSEDAKDFKPPGRLVHSYITRQRNYEIWAGSLADPDVRRLLDRIQVCVSFFIEAGTPIAMDDPEWTLERWMVYFVYAVLARRRHNLTSLTHAAVTKKSLLPLPQHHSTLSSVTQPPIAGGSIRETLHKSRLLQMNHSQWPR